MSADLDASSITRLSLLEREAFTLVGLERFGARYRIEHAALSGFIEHMWGLMTVTPETWVAWVDAFDAMEVLRPSAEYSSSLAAAVPSAVRQDFSALAKAVFEMNAATWYCSNESGTLDALVLALRIMAEHAIELPAVVAFDLSVGKKAGSWAVPTLDNVEVWRQLGRAATAWRGFRFA